MQGSNILKKYRLRKKMTQVEFANWIGISQPSVSQLEIGMLYPRHDTYVKLWRLDKQLVIDLLEEKEEECQH